MSDDQRIALVVAVAAAITWGLRAIPFAVLAPLSQSALLARLRVTMPLGILVILVLYSLSSVPVTSQSALTYGVAVGVTAAVQLWRRNALLSILVGTALHVALATLVS